MTKESVGCFSKEENLPHVQAKLLAKDLEEQLKPTNNFIEVVDRPHRKNWRDYAALQCGEARDFKS